MNQQKLENITRKCTTTCGQIRDLLNTLNDLPESQSDLLVMSAYEDAIIAYLNMVKARRALCEIKPE